MSGQGESEFDLCMNVNLRGFMNLIERCRKVGAEGKGDVVHLTFTSTGAVFGPLPLVTDETKPSPMTTYGTTKVRDKL
jgi:nucleoside-diphosphate-sugar epimerase